MRVAPNIGPKQTQHGRDAMHNIVVTPLTLLGLQSRFGDNLETNYLGFEWCVPKRDWSSKRVKAHTSRWGPKESNIF